MSVPAAASAAIPTSPPGRIPALDLARGIAILGMFFAHAAPVAAESPLALKALAAGAQVTAPLFVMLAGVSIGLMSGGATPVSRGRRAGTIAQLARRAGALILIGLVLWQLNSRIAIVIDYIGITTLLLLLVLFLPRLWLVAVAAAAVVASPMLHEWSLASGLAAEAAANPVTAKIVSWLFAGPSYWAPMFLFFALSGLILARSDVRRPATARWCMLSGPGLALLGAACAVLTADSAHPGSNSTAGNLVAIGCATSVIGFLLWIYRRQVGGYLPRMLGPVEAAGRMPLTIYTLQVFLFAGFGRLFDVTNSWPFLIGITIVSLVGAWAWMRFVASQGPLERVVSWASGRSKSTRQLARL
ncbi:acyltransferase family protein [Zhihengliuella halotolerans]|uniref:Putative membrane protein YeiB n=1 Tax=Zhihengliuella halotolerans TaxID=370736 RepID=A0A4Q8AD69_9MICC|nr:acyltransferase family protein [Zhihengliuella halotolerans]RZU62064.1 putative membrane protein YeiB [Zhihengliuella halotolerans]